MPFIAVSDRNLAASVLHYSDTVRHPSACLPACETTACCHSLQHSARWQELREVELRFSRPSSSHVFVGTAFFK